MLQSQSSNVQKRIQSCGSPRSPLNTVTKDFNSPFGVSSLNIQTVPKVEPGLNNEMSDTLSILSHEGAAPCIGHAGEQLSGLGNAPLPFTSKEHDLVDMLSHVIKHEVSHPKRDSSETVSTILSTQLLSQMALVEMKTHAISMKSFANALNTNAATFSLSLREPRHWFDSSVTVRRNYYAIFLWLNLPPRERRASFKRPVDSDGSDDENPSPVENVPNLHLLSSAVIKELKNHGLDFGDFVQKVARYPNECVIRNLLLAPLPWEVLSTSLRKRYGLMWFWMKQTTVERLRLFNIEYIEDNNNDVVIMKDDDDFGEAIRVQDQPANSFADQTDTVKIAQQVIHCLASEMMSVDQFAEKILRLPPRMVTPLVHTPIAWPSTKNYERFVYNAMARYIGIVTDHLTIDVDTREVSRDVLRFLREHGISTTDFAAKVVRLQRATLTNYLNNPVPWLGSTDQQQQAFVIMSHWLDLTKEDKLAQFYHQPNTAKLSPDNQRSLNPFPNPGKGVENSREVLQTVVDISKNNFFSNPEGSKRDLEVETFTLASNINDLVSSGGLNLKNFAAALRVNKNYLASLLKNPVPWSSATKLQRFIFYAAKNVLRQKSNGFDSLITSAAAPVTSLRPPTPSSSRSATASPIPAKEKLKRERLSVFQFNYLKDYFQKNQRPSTVEKQQLADLLGLTLRKVGVFFSNHRVRGFGKKYSSGGRPYQEPQIISSSDQSPEMVGSPEEEMEVTAFFNQNPHTPIDSASS